ncbi:MAG: hypothetical protein H7222_05835 [Methylotenera sp.]|nr:hypothetical protein [Oligoflexia bacterium]
MGTENTVNAVHALLPSSWDTYYVVFISALLGVAVSLLLRSVSRRTKRTHTTPPELTPKKNSDTLGRKINVRFFLGTNAAFLLITLGFLLIPCVGTLHEKPESARGLISIVTLAALASLGLFYAVRKGDLTWERSFQKPSPARASEPSRTGSSSEEELP